MGLHNDGPSKCDPLVAPSPTVCAIGPHMSSNSSRDGLLCGTLESIDNTDLHQQELYQDAMHLLICVGATCAAPRGILELDAYNHLQAKQNKQWASNQYLVPRQPRSSGCARLRDAPIQEQSRARTRTRSTAARWYIQMIDVPRAETRQQREAHLLKTPSVELRA